MNRTAIRRFSAAFILFALLMATSGRADPAPATQTDAVDMTPAERMMQAQLAQAIPKIAADAVAFTEMIDFLRDVSGASIFVNWKSLEAAGIHPQAPVTVKLRNVRLSTAIERILNSVSTEKAKLGYEIGNGVIYIATTGDLPSYKMRPISKTYDIRPLIPEKLTGAARVERTAALLRLITEAVDPASWSMKGVKGETTFTIAESNGELTIVQTVQNQVAIGNLLIRLREYVGLLQ